MTEQSGLEPATLIALGMVVGSVVSVTFWREGDALAGAASIGMACTGRRPNAFLLARSSRSSPAWTAGMGAEPSLSSTYQRAAMPGSAGTLNTCPTTAATSPSARIFLPWSAMFEPLKSWPTGSAFSYAVGKFLTWALSARPPGQLAERLMPI